MNVMRRMLVLVLAAMLTACAAPKLTQQQAASIKSVGIVSLLPQELKYRKMGITVFNNEFKSLPVAGDALNAHARLSAEQYLRQSGKYQVKQILVRDEAAMAARLNARTLVMSHDVERIDKELADLAKANNVDAVIVIAENFDAERGIFGVTMAMRAGLGDIRAAAAMAGIQVAGVTASKEIFMSSYPNPGMGAVVVRPDGKPWSYKLEENLDDATHQKIIKALLPDIAGMIDGAMSKAGMY